MKQKDKSLGDLATISPVMDKNRKRQICSDSDPTKCVSNRDDRCAAHCRILPWPTEQSIM
jgi:hypothetical protein